LITRERYGLNGATTGTADLLVDLRVAQEAGFAALELREVKVADYLRQGGTLPALRAAFARAGVAPLSLNALERSTLATGEEWEAVRQRCRTLCEWAQALDCPYVVAVPSPWTDAPDARRIREQTVEALAALAGIARSFGVRLGFEFLGFGSCSVNTLEAAREIVAQVADPAVGLVIDAFHFYVGGSAWSSLDGVDPRSLFIVHLDDAEDRPRADLTDAHRLLPGAGVIPLERLVRRLEALGYDGVYSVELFRPEYWAWEPLELAKEARASLEALFTKVQEGEG
jgi:2-keto-myo-inositol isomerase